MDRDIDNTGVLESEVVDQPSPGSQEPATRTTTAGHVCKALRDVGMAQVNPSHQTLMALVNAGATVQEFVDVAIEQKSKPGGKFNFSYVVGAVKGRREDAAKLQLHKGPMPNRQESLENKNRAATDGWKPPELREGQA